MREYQNIFSVVGTIEWQATEQSEGASKQLNEAKERHMDWKLRYGTLLMVPQVGARDRMVP